MLSVEIVLNSTKNFKKYCKAILNVFFYEKKFADEKKNIYMIDFLC